jgi:hypothetical protein
MNRMVAPAEVRVQGGSTRRVMRDPHFLSTTGTRRQQPKSLASDTWRHDVTISELRRLHPVSSVDDGAPRERDRH